MEVQRILILLGLGIFLEVTSTVTAQNAQDIRVPAPVVEIKNEPSPKLIVDDPLPEQLRQGLVIIEFRTENMRIVPIFGANALGVSPRIGHLHISVDDLPWHWADASNQPLIIVNLPPGPHKVLVALADPTHRVVASKIVKFTIPKR